MGITCKMNGGKNLKGIYSQKIFSMGITCKLNWENLHVISSQKKIIWESLVKWTQIKFKGKSNERKREISKKEKKIEEREEKKRKVCLGRLFSFSSMQPSKLSLRGSRRSALILSPVAGSSFRWSRMGSQFDLFLFYISPLEKSFLISKIDGVS